MPAVAQFAVERQGLQSLERRRHVLEALAVWLQRQGAVDAVELALQVIDAPAVEFNQAQVALMGNFRQAVRHESVVDARAGCGCEVLPSTSIFT